MTESRPPQPTGPDAGGRRLQVDILTALVSLLVLTVGAVALHSWTTSRDTLRALATTLLQSTADAVISKTTDHLVPAARLAEIAARVQQQAVAAGEPLDLLEDADLERELRASVEAFSQVSMAYVGDVSGRALLVKRLADGTFGTKRVTPPGLVEEPPTTPTEPTVDAIPDAGEAVVETPAPAPRLPANSWTYTDELGRVLRSEVIDEAYNPRTRPWFKGAAAQAGTYWSDLYVFHSDRQPGLSAARRVTGADGSLVAVFGTDVGLGELSDFLSTLRIGRTGRAFIVDAADHVVAYPEEEQAVRVEGDVVQPRLASELSEGWVAAALAASRAAGEGQAEYHHEGRTILSAFRHFPAEFGKSWSIVVVVPEEEVLGALVDAQRVTLGIALVVLLLGIVAAIRLSRSISSPIVSLTEVARRITALDFGGETHVRSNIHELRELSRAMHAMKGAVGSFAKYVPADVVRQLVSTGEDVKVGGERRELTLFFSDIEGFTSLAESMPAEQLLSHMGEYLDELTRIVMEEHGTVDKFIGDAIMAFWNAPTPEPEHAAAACRTALRCQKRLDELAVRWVAEGKVPLPTRIGLATGEVIVGNVGSGERLNYTAIGDTVNLAARLEGANKRYGTRILVSASTAERVKGQFHLRPVDVVAVKGKSTAVRVFELLGEKGGPDDATRAMQAERGTDAFELFLQREWELAAATFEELLELNPDDEVSRRLLQRVEAHRTTPPPTDWDGTSKLREK